MRLTVALAAALLVSPLFAEEAKEKEAKKSGCQVGEGLGKFDVVPVTGRFEKGKGTCYI
jgi:hypothetical protein